MSLDDFKKCSTRARKQLEASKLTEAQFTHVLWALTRRFYLQKSKY